MLLFLFFFFKQKTAYEMRISDWSSDVCSSDLADAAGAAALHRAPLGGRQRSPPSRRLGADLLERGGLRGRPSSRPVGHAQPSPAPGAGPRWSRRAHPRRGGLSGDARAPPPPPVADCTTGPRWAVRPGRPGPPLTAPPPG